MVIEPENFSFSFSRFLYAIYLKFLEFTLRKPSLMIRHYQKKKNTEEEPARVRSSTKRTLLQSQRRGKQAKLYTDTPKPSSTGSSPPEPIPTEQQVLAKLVGITTIIIITRSGTPRGEGSGGRAKQHNGSPGPPQRSSVSTSPDQEHHASVRVCPSKITVFPSSVCFVRVTARWIECLMVISRPGLH